MDLERRVEELDEIAWEKQGDQPRPHSSAYMAIFRRARFASAIWFALGTDVESASDDCLYEVHFALEDQQVVRALIAAELAQ